MTNKHIVVVNDDPAQLRMISGVIERIGYDVTTYDDPVRAVSDLRDRPGVDLFVVDLHMPGIDGWKLCGLLRSPEFASFNMTPILIVSATFTGVDVNSVIAELGANAFLPLPFGREDLLEHVVDLLSGKVPRRRSRVLIVEDDPGIARATRKAFESHGFTVDTVATAGAAVQVWSECSADVVLLDYHLPDDTCEGLITHLSSASPQTVVIVMTGDMSLELPVSILRLGADGYVRKPFDPALIVELALRAQRERALLRVEALLEERTRELNASERRFRSLFDAIPDLVMVLTPDGHIRRASEAAQQILGLPSDDAARTSFLDIVTPDQADRVDHALGDIRANGAGTFETTLLGAGQELEVEVTGTMTEDEGRPALLLVARDQTWRRQAENERTKLQEQVSHAQRLDSLGVLAGGIAHDFNNLLVGILGNANLARLESAEGDSVWECVTQIETAAMRAAELTSQILTFAGKSTTVKRAVRLPDIVKEMGQLLERVVSRQAHIVYRMCDRLDPIEGDPSQLRQVVMNLIMNASDALGPEPGTVTVTTHEAWVGGAELRSFHLGDAASPGRYACLEVADNGRGMDDATLHRIFDPFFTTKDDGHGLGLSTTIGIVRAHGGILAVDSEPGQGTRFRVLFPYSRHLATRVDPHDLENRLTARLPARSGRSGERTGHVRHG